MRRATERIDRHEGRTFRRYSFRGLDVDITSLAITFLFFAFLTLFALKWLGREDE